MSWQYNPWYCTIGCCYNVIQYTTILHTTLHWLRKNINQNLNSIKPPDISPSQASYMGCLSWGLWENGLRYSRTTLYSCIVLTCSMVISRSMWSLCELGCHPTTLSLYSLRWDYNARPYWISLYCKCISYIRTVWNIITHTIPCLCISLTFCELRYYKSYD